MFNFKTDAEARELRRKRNQRYRAKLKARASTVQSDGLRDTLTTATPSALALVVCNLVSKRADALEVFDAIERTAREKKGKLSA